MGHTLEDTWASKTGICWPMGKPEPEVRPESRRSGESSTSGCSLSGEQKAVKGKVTQVYARH